MTNQTLEGWHDHRQARIAEAERVIDAGKQVVYELSIGRHIQAACQQFVDLEESYRARTQKCEDTQTVTESEHVKARLAAADQVMDAIDEGEGWHSWATAGGGFRSAFVNWKNELDERVKYYRALTDAGKENV